MRLTTVAVAQLAEQWLLTPATRGSKLIDLIVDKVICLQMSHFVISKC